MKLEGYSVLWNALSLNLGGFRERFTRGAFGDLRGADVRFLIGHNDASVPLGRTKSGTLRLWNDSRGLGFEVDLPDSEPARTLFEAVRRGDLTGMSFAFTGAQDKWEQDAEGLLRTVTAATLTEVSAVAWPAYPATRVSVAGDLSATPSAKSETVRQMCERQAVAARMLPASLDLARRRMQLARMRDG